MQLSAQLLVLFSVTVAPAAGAVQDDGWSRFRGPNGTGVAETGALPTTLDPERTLRWRTALPAGHSSPIVWERHVYVTAQTGEGDAEKLLVVCLSIDTGDVLWKREAPRDRVTKVDGRNNSASPSPVASEQGVIVFFPDFGLAAYDHEGEERWRHALGPFDNLYGMGASPILVEGKVVLACDQNIGSYLIALSEKDGSVVWRTERPMARSGHCTPVIRRTLAANELLLPGSFTLDAYDLKSGERRWWFSGLSFEMKSVPVLAGDTVFVNGYGSPLNQVGNQIDVPPFSEVSAENDGDGDGKISAEEMPPSRATQWFDFVDLNHDGGLDEEEWGYLRAALRSTNGLLAIRPGGSGDITEKALLWEYRRAVPQLPTPVLYRDVLYMLADGGGLLTTFRPESGEVIERGRLADAVDTYYASPVASDGKLFLVSEHGIVSVLPAGGKLEPLSTVDLEENCYATPAIVDGRVILRTTEALYCFEVRD